MQLIDSKSSGYRMDGTSGVRGAVLLLAMIAACKEPTACIEEVTEFREFVAGPGEPSRADAMERDGWQCTLLRSVSSPPGFPPSVRRDWRCTRCQ